MRGNWLATGIFRDYDDIVDFCCDVWRRIADPAWRVISTGHRQ